MGQRSKAGNQGEQAARQCRGPEVTSRLDPTYCALTSSPNGSNTCTQPQLSEHMAWYTRARNAQWAGLTMRAFNGAFGAFGTHHFWGGHSAVGVPSDVGNVPCVVLQIRFLHTPGHQSVRASASHSSAQVLRVESVWCVLHCIMHCILAHP